MCKQHIQVEHIQWILLHQLQHLTFCPSCCFEEVLKNHFPFKMVRRNAQCIMMSTGFSVTALGVGWILTLHVLAVWLGKWPVLLEAQFLHHENRFNIYLWRWFGWLSERMYVKNWKCLVCVRICGNEVLHGHIGFPMSVTVCWVLF